ncbi:MAG: hypothetical protein ACD_2C00018G0002 [uncultured bacterium (gcode 4)]|uniref:dUTPase-like domain-containing protein n=1 Tax=uncultured bacterium (gcode 4) TaxID=1234023 RepID=K2GIH3_9BACT|nr:MAG: hypothetical protein ACD_2C00018G0002 [uncultured bacterium (gcode 4)]
MDKIIVCTYDEGLLPEKKTPGAVCWDMRASLDFEVQPGEVRLISAWFKTYIPLGWCAKFYARSWMPTKSLLMQWNNIAIMDPDYRGEYLMQMYNFTKDAVKHEKYTRLCQIEFSPYWHEWKFGTDYVPEIEFIVDKDLYDKFDEHYASERWTGWIWSTWHK